MNVELEKFLQQRGSAPALARDGFSGLMRAWERAVKDVADGTAIDTDDYLNDLDLRTIIFDFMAQHPKQKNSILARLADADELFKQVTWETPHCIWGAANEVSHNYRPAVHWWLYRSRRNSTDDPRD